MTKPLTLDDFSRTDLDQVAEVKPEDLVPLPPPYDKAEELPPFKEVTAEKREQVDFSLDGFSALGLRKLQTDEEEKELVEKFLTGLRKLFTKENNWLFLRPLMITTDHCARCQTCVQACPVFEMSGGHDLYRPTYRSEIFRRLVEKHVKPGGGLWSRFKGSTGIELNGPMIRRLAELAYRCTLCRRCAQTCPIGVDNALVTRELRKLFSQELGLTADELHKSGTVLQLKVGSSTGMNALVVKDNCEFIEEDIQDRWGLEIKIPWDKEGADVLLIHNAGEVMAWPDNVAAFAIILEKAGVSWTMSSEPLGYDGVNYGLFYDDVQLARVAVKHADIAKRLGVRKIVAGECGHETKVQSLITDRLLVDDLNIPRENAMTFLEDLVMSGRLELDPSRNDFPVTLHDPCNLVRLMGVVEPQRRILRKLCPQFREMTPHGVENYCCGGGSGFAIMSGNNFEDWRNNVSSRKKFQQILGAFSDCLSPEVPKYVCAPCSNCKGAIRDFFRYYGATEKSNLHYGGLVELICNAMPDLSAPFISFEDEW